MTLRSEEDRSMLHMYIWRQRETHHTLKKGGVEREDRNTMEGVSVLGYTVHVYGIIAMKSPCNITICKFKNKIKFKKKKESFLIFKICYSKYWK
jgi:hypothetical protein